MLFGKRPTSTALDSALAGAWSTVIVATGPSVSYLTKSKVEGF